MSDEIRVDIVEAIGNIGPANEMGWRKELNIVSWNGGEAKYDIRQWSPDHSRMTRGITLTSDEMSVVHNLIAGRF